MRKADRVKVDVKRQHQMDVYRFKAVFRNAPDLPIVFNGVIEGGVYREFSHFETEDGTVIFKPRARRDWDSVDSVKEVDG